VSRALGRDGEHVSVLSLALSPDGRRVVTTHSHHARVWNAESGAELLRVASHTVMIRNAAFSPDGRRLATAGFDKSVKLWDLETGHELITLKGHNIFHCISFNTDGARIVAGCGSDAIIWDGRPVDIKPALKSESL